MVPKLSILGRRVAIEVGNMIKVLIINHVCGVVVTNFFILSNVTDKSVAWPSANYNYGIYRNFFMYIAIYSSDMVEWVPMLSEMKPSLSLEINVAIVLREVVISLREIRFILT